MTSKSPDNLSHQPLYLQIKETLKLQILTGQYAPYQRMPSESELMATFGVSRITVRQALRDLHSEGLIFTAQGKGTFASKPKAMQDVRHLEGFAEAMSRQGYETTSRLLGIDEVTPNRDVQEHLELGARAKAVRVVRIRYLNREPVSVDTSFFPADIGKRLLGRNLERDIFPLLENELGIALGTAQISLEARAADSDTAKHLKAEIGAPIMWVQRLTRDQSGKAVDYEYLAVRGDSYQYRFQIERHHGRQL